MKKASTEKKLAILFTIILVVSLSAAAFAWTFTVTVNLDATSNVAGWGTSVYKCNDPDCKTFDLTTVASASGASPHIYDLTQSGSFLRLEYNSSANSHIYIDTLPDNPQPASTTRTIKLEPVQSCRSPIRTIDYIGTNGIQQGSTISLKSNIASTLVYSILKDISTLTTLPENIKSYYSPKTDVTFFINNTNTNTIVLGPTTIQSNILANTTPQISLDDWTPTDNGDYFIEVRTKVTDPICNQATTLERAKNITISVSDTGPTKPDFANTSKREGVAPFTVSFNSIINSADLDQPFTYEWDFNNDGTVDSTGSSPTHEFTQVGKHSVKLKIKDKDGSPMDSDVKTDYITVFSQTPPTPDFSASSTSGTEPLQVTFIDSSSTPAPDSIAKWEWDFDGDNVIDSILQNPLPHTYYATNPSQSYNAKLTVTTVGGLTKSKTSTITVNDAKPTANFNVPTITEDVSAQFTDASTTPNDQIVGWLWNFGDTSTSTLQTPLPHIYTLDGTYTVSLTVTDYDGSTDTKTVPVSVGFVNDAPTIIGTIPTITLNEDFGTYTIDLTQFESDEENGQRDGNGLGWSISGVSTSLITANIDPNLDVLTLNSISNSFGTNSVLLTLTDSLGKTVSQQVLITVNSVNDPPQFVSPIQNQTWNEDSSKTINIKNNFADVEGIIDYTSSPIAGISVDINNVTGDVTFTSAQNLFGNRTVIFTAYDTNQATVNSNIVYLGIDAQAEISQSSTVSTDSNINPFSFVYNSVVSGGSSVVNTSITNSTVTGSTLTNVTLINSTVINTVLENVTLENVYINPSTVRNSVIRNSVVRNSTVLNSTVTGSTILNMTVTSASVLNEQFTLGGSILFDGVTYTAPKSLAFIYDRTPVKTGDIANINWNEDTIYNSLNLNTVFSDPDGDALTFTNSTILNIAVSINQATGIVTFSPDGNFTGTRQVQFTATDPLGRFVLSNTITITVDQINDRPFIIGTLAPEMQNEDFSSYSVSLYGNEGDVESSGTGLNWSVVVQNTSIVNAAITDVSNDIVTYSPVSNATGQTNILFTLTDSEGLSTNQTILFTVNPVNDQPFRTADIPAIIFNEDSFNSSLDLNNYFSDIDTGTLVYSTVGANNLTTIITGPTVNITADQNFNGQRSLTFIASDGQYSTSSSVSVIVNPVNDAPTTSTMPNQTWSEDTNLTVNISQYFADVDQDGLSFSVIQSPTNASVLINGSLATFNPNLNFFGSDSVKFRANDGAGGIVDSNIITLNINPSNDAPVLSSVPSIIFAEDAFNNTLDLNGLVSDVDNSDSEINWTITGQTNIVVTIDNTTKTINFTAAQDFFGSENITLTAVDQGSLVDSKQVTVTVNSVNDAPFVATNVPDVQFNEDALNSSINLSNYFGDVDSTSLVYSTLGSNNLTVSIVGSLVNITADQNFNGQRNLTFTASDGQYSIQDTILVTVNPVNDAPTMTAQIPDISFSEEGFNDTLNLNNYFADVDNATLVYTATVFKPNPLSVDSENLTVNITGSLVMITSAPDFYGTRLVNFGASDGSQQFQSTITVTVNAVNDAPVFNSSAQLSNLNFDEDTTATLNLTPSFHDVDNSDLNWTFSSSDITNITVSINQDTGIVSFMPDGNFSGIRAINFTATDSMLTSEQSNTILVAVNAVNDAPFVATNVPDVQFNEDLFNSSLDLSNYFGDVDNTSLVYSTLGADNLTVSIVGSLVNITADQNFNGQRNLTFTSSDGQYPANDAILVTVNAVNDAPSLVSSIPNHTWSEDTNQTLDVTPFFFDIENELTTAFSIQSPENISVSSIGNIFTFSPPQNFNGVNSIYIRAYDSQGASVNSSTFYLNVTPVNDAPSIITAPQTTATEDILYTYDANETDVESDAIIFSFLSNPANMTINNSTGTIQWTPDNSQVGLRLVSILVSDLNGGTDTQNFTIITSNSNDLPVLSSIVDQSTTEDTPHQFNLTASDDDLINGENLTYTINDTRFNVAKVSEDLATISFLPTNNDVGSFPIRLTVTDSASSSDSKVLLINVTNTNDAPEFNSSAPLQNVTFNEDSAGTLDISGSFFDVDANTDLDYSSSVVQNISVNINQTTGIVTFTPSQDFFGTRTITFKATDGIVNSTDSNTITIIVSPVNDAPTLSASIPDVSFDEDLFNSSLDLSNNFVDVDNATLVYSTLGADNLTVSIVGSLVNITTDQNFNGQRNLTFTGSDGQYPANGTITVTVNPINDVPITLPIPGVTFEEDNQTTINLAPYVMDVDNLPSELNWTAGPSGSGGPQECPVFSINYSVDNVAKTVTIMGNQNACGVGGLMLSTFDPSMTLSNSTSVQINITPVNDAPIFNTSAPLFNVSFNEDTTATLNLTPSFHDVDNSDLNWTFSSSDITNITVSINQDTGIVSFMPDGNFSGSRTINFTATDNLLTSGQSNTITVAVNAVNDAPFIELNVPDVQFDEDLFNSSLDLSNYFGDVDNTSLVYSTLGADNLTVSIVESLVNITADQNFNGQRNLTFTSSDGQYPVNDAILVTVNAVNDAPVLSSVPSIIFAEDTFNSTLDLNALVSDVDNLDSEINWTATGQTNVIVTINNATKYINFNAVGNFSGTEIVNLTSVDVDGLTDMEQVTVIVNPVNDNPQIDTLTFENPTVSYEQFVSGNLDVKSTASDPADPSGLISKVDFEYSLDSTDGLGGTWTTIFNDTLSPFQKLSWQAEPQSGTDSLVWIRAIATDNEGGRSSYFVGNISVDNQAPNTTHDYDNQWKTSDITVNLTGNDFNGSSVSSRQYRINGNVITKTVEADGQPIINTEGASNFIEFQSVDNIGFSESLKNLTVIKLDKTNPVLQPPVIFISNLTEDSTGAYTINVNIFDSVSGLASTPTITYWIGSQSPTTSPLTLVSGNDYNFTIQEPVQTWDFFRGESLTFTINATDNAGRTNSTQNVDLIDNINDLPTTSIVSINNLPPSYRFFQPISLEEITATATDSNDTTGNSALAGSIPSVLFEYSLDSTNGSDGTFTSCSGSNSTSVPNFTKVCNNILSSGQEDSSIWIRVRAQDNSGGFSSYSTQQIAIDNKAPVTGDNITQEWLNSTISINLNATDSGSGVSTTKWLISSVNSGTPSTLYTGDISFGAEGINYLRYRSIDNVSNQEVIKNKTIRIDLTLPQVNSVTVSDDYVKNNTAVEIIVNASDPVSNGASSGIASVFASGLNLTNIGSGLFNGTISLTTDPVQLIVKDVAGNTRLQNFTTFTIDDVAPYVNLVTLTGHNNGVFSPNSDGLFDIITFIINGSEIVSIGAVMTNSSQSIVTSFGGTTMDTQTDILRTWDGQNIAEYPYSTVPDGVYTLNATLTDKADNSNTTTITTIEVDNTKPTLNFVSPTPVNGSYNNSQIVNLTASDSHPQNITLIVNDSVVKVCSFTEDCSYTLSHGTHVFYALANDTVGNIISTEFKSVLIDLVQPQIQLTSPSNNSVVRGNIFLTASGSDETSLANMSIFVDGSAITSQGICDSDPVSPCMVPFDTTTVLEGSHIITATARDPTGNSNTTSPVTIVVDNRRPQIEFNSPSEGVYTTTQTVNITASDDHLSTILLKNGSTVLNSTTSTELLFTLTDGNYTLQGIANDTVGNPANSTNARSVIIDTTNPSISFANPTPIDTSLVGGSQNQQVINVTASDNILVKNITILIDNAVQKTCSSSPCEFNWNTTQFSDIVHTVNATVFDIADRQSSTEIRGVDVDNTAPAITLSSLPNNTLSNSQTQGFSFNTTDAFTDVACELYISNNGEPYTLSGSNSTVNSLYPSGENTTITNSTVLEGTNYWFARCTDFLDNYADSEVRTLITDYTAPYVTSFAITGTNNGIFSPANLDGQFDEITVIINTSEPVTWGAGSTQIRNSTHPISYFNGNGIDGSNTSLVKQWTGEESADPWAPDGVYTINTTFTDLAGNRNTTSVLGYVTIDNTPPQFTMNTTATLTEDELGLFNGTNVLDSDVLSGVNSSSLVWDFGNGTLKIGVIVTHSYAQNNTYTIRLNATDLVGNNGSSTTTITVTDLGPTANFTYSPISGIFESSTPVTFTDLSTSSPDTISSRFWGFGDGTNSTVTNPTHQFAQNNTYTVSLTVTDSDNSTSTLTQNIFVADGSPSASLSGNDTINEGETAIFTTITSTLIDIITNIEWDFDYNGTFTVDANTGTTNTVNNTFNSNGTQTIAVRVTDSDNSTVVSNFTLNVQDIDPTSSLMGNSVLFQGQRGTFDASGTTTGPDTITQYEWDFNYSVSVEFNSTPGFSASVVNYTFATPSTYTVAVRVTDSDNSTSVSTLNVSVNPSTHDVSVDSIAYNKSASTVYLYDQIMVSANISNIGSFAENNVTVLFRTNGDILETRTETLAVNQTKQINFTWIPSVTGFKSPKIQILPISGEMETVNNEKVISNVKTFSMVNSVNLQFVSNTSYPKPIDIGTESSGSTFFVWFRLSSNATENLKDVSVTVNTNGLTINTNQDGSANNVKTYSVFNGTRTFWWELNSGSASTKNITVTVGNSGDQKLINRTVNVV